MPSLRDPFRDAAAETSVGGLGRLGWNRRCSSFRKTAGTSAAVVGARLPAAVTRTLPIATGPSSTTACSNAVVRLRRAVR
jgi:hypothetical protein